MVKEAGTIREIGILGGTFNPPHNAHLIMARAALTSLQLDEVWLLPSGYPPYKRVDGASPAQRMAMATAAAAVADERRVKAIDIETRREGSTYTLDTMRELVSSDITTGVPASYTFLIGMDSLAGLRRWYGIGELASMCRFAVFPRAGMHRGDAETAIEQARRDYGLRVGWINADPPGISSTELRTRVRVGLSLEAYVPAAVQDYIDRERLYNPPPTLPRCDMVRILKETLSPQRFEHSLAVERKAAELARVHNIPQDKAALAGLLHDCAKYLSLEDMRAEAVRLGVETDAGRWDSGELLHSIVGAAMLRERFGVTDPDILSAVRWHTTGRAGMSALDTAVYLADKIEDCQAAYPGLDAVRALAVTDLVGAAILSMRGNIEYVAARGFTLHPGTLDALSYLGSIARP